MSTPLDVARLDDRELIQLIEERFGALTPATHLGVERLAGATAEITERFRHLLPVEPRPAAVLVPIVTRAEGSQVLLTQRASHLRNHGGQVSFPGGRLESGDPGPLEAALRETEEEIGLLPRFVRPVGYLEDHLVISGFRVTPIIAFVEPGFSLKLDTHEVEDTFEVPLRHVLDPTHHRLRERTIGDLTFHVYDIPFQDRNIWGATAGILMTFYRRLVGLEG